jgi:endonuclease G
MASHFLDQIPLDFSDPAAKELRRLLSGNYSRSTVVIKLMREAGAAPEYVNWDQSMILAWDEALDTLQRQGKLRTLLENLINGPDAALAARLRELVADQPVTEAPPDTADGLSAPVLEPGGLERIIEGDSTLLDVSFLQRGLELASAVVRLGVRLDGKGHAGTGFRIGDDLLLSNHHVLFGNSGKPATRVDAWFGFESSFDGQMRPYTSVPCRTDTIAGDRVHDWAVIRLAGPPPAGTAVISLEGAPPPEVDDRVYIIQHPLGGPKKIGMVHNVIRYIDDNLLRYWTDTEEGSSGSPVFNERWQLVGLHHSSVTVQEEPQPVFYNQGCRIERVAEGLKELGIQ